MIKVEIPLANYDLLPRQKEMKDWCRKTFGRNRRGEPQIWRGTFEMALVDEHDIAGWVHFLIFFFRTQEQANWFLLRWR